MKMIELATSPHNLKDGAYPSDQVQLFGRDFSNHGDYVVLKKSLNVGIITKKNDKFHAIAVVPGFICFQTGEIISTTQSEHETLEAATDHILTIS